MNALGLGNLINSIIVKNGFGQLILKRSILQSAASSNGRFRSKCEINGNQVTLKALRSISKPLITIVDAAAASSALSQTKSRIAIIDTGVPNTILSNAKLSKDRYREARKKREDIEREIRNRIMPTSFTSSDGEENIELLQHWISELDDFEERILSFQESIVSSRGAASLLKDDNFEDESENDTTIFSKSNNNGGSSFVDIMKNFADCSWKKDETSGQDSSSIEASIYSNILDLRDGVKSLDSQLSSAQASCDALSSLSSSQSVAYALEESRRHLFDATTGFENNQSLNAAAEQSHELLNQLEDALSKCSSFMSDHPSGLMSTIEKMRGSVNISVEDIDLLIADWGSLARKHGVTPFLLPALHYSLRQELDGNVEAQSLLPKAQEDERIAIVEFENACNDLSKARLEVCNSLTKSVTSRLKDLGMEGSKFTAQLNKSIHKCTDSSAYADGSILGIDTVDFLLAHRNSEQDSHENGSEKTDGNRNKGNLDVIGSSGEKARLLLAIETDLAGSVGASCNLLSNNNKIVEAKENLSVDNLCPVSVVYDEIDAHVGGNAAVSVAKLLADQAHLRSDNFEDLRRNQVISITHSPSLAAIADQHIVIQKLISTRGKDSVLVHSAKGLSRLQEIARMASGDLAVEESIQFAEALLRDGLKYKQSKASSSMNKSK